MQFTLDALTEKACILHDTQLDKATGAMAATFLFPMMYIRLDEEPSESSMKPLTPTGEQFGDAHHTFVCLICRCVALRMNVSFNHT